MLRVLVADDSPTIRRRAQSTLADAGYDVTCVEDGAAAWAALESAGGFGFLLCDILMPALDGYELCRRVKSDDRFRAIPVLLLRGTFEPWDETKAVEAGADGFVEKPFDSQTLIQTMKDVMAEMAPPPVAAPAPVPFGEPLSAESPLGSPLDLGEPVAPEGEGVPLPVGPPVAEPLPVESPLGDLGAAAVEDPFGAGELPEPAAPFLADPAGPLGALGAEPLAPEAPAAPEPPAPAPFFEPPPTVTPAAPAAPAAFAGAPAAASPPPVALAGPLDEATIQRIADLVAARLVGRELERVAWDVVPDVAEALIRKRLLEIEAQLGEG